MNASASSPSGQFPWRPQTLFAPMEGVTHPVLREMMAERGDLGIVCTEFVRVTARPLGKKILEKHVVRPSRGALSVQVMGNNIEQMAEATAMVTDAGADIVDINLGCPAPRAVRKGVGSAMLKDLKLLGRVLEAMRSRTTLPLSAKIRAGYDDASGVLDVARVVQESGADFIAVHPRRRVDFYQGVADWRIITRLVRELSIPVVGNGDIWYAADALRLQEETGCEAVMIGRPALRNPWIFNQIASLKAGRAAIHPDGDAVISHLRDLAQRLQGGFKERSALGMLKEQIRYIARTLPDAGAYGREALRSPTVEVLLEHAEKQFSGMPAEALDLQAQAGRLERSGSGKAPEAGADSSPVAPLHA